MTKKQQANLAVHSALNTSEGISKKWKAAIVRGSELAIITLLIVGCNKPVETKIIDSHDILIVNKGVQVSVLEGARYIVPKAGYFRIPAFMYRLSGKPIYNGTSVELDIGKIRCWYGNNVVNQQLMYFGSCSNDFKADSELILQEGQEIVLWTYGATNSSNTIVQILIKGSVLK